MEPITLLRARLFAAGLAGAITLSGAIAATPKSDGNDDHRIVSFSVPASPGGTIALGMNDFGVITGYSLDSVGVAHGYVRSANGRIASFDGPAAPATGTYPSGINKFGTVVGTYDDSNGLTHGFLRQASGTITTIDVGSGGETAPWSINASGAVVGYYLDGSDTYHGFLRTPGGTIITLDAPGAAVGSFQGTFAYNVNAAGVVEGQFEDGSGVYHCFVRYPDGTFITVDAPNAGTGLYQGTITGLEGSLSDSGLITGEYVDVNAQSHGFLRLASGRTIEFDVPTGSSGTNTSPSSVNFEGDVVGWSTGAAGTAIGFLRRPDGSVKTINGPGSGDLGTYAVAVNDTRSVAGFFYDSTGIPHGFVRTSDD